MATLRKTEREHSQLLKYIVLLEDQNGTTMPVELEAAFGVATDYLFAKAVSQYRQRNEGKPLVSLRLKEVITIIGQHDFEPPRPNLDGYRKTR